MPSEERQIVLRVVENFIHTGSANDEQVNVTSLPENKTSHVERIGEDGRSVMLTEYRLEGKIIWAGYSSRSKTVYLSPKTS
jgi:hypothetical protein